MVRTHLHSHTAHFRRMNGRSLGNIPQPPPPTPKSSIFINRGALARKLLSLFQQRTDSFTRHAMFQYNQDSACPQTQKKSGLEPQRGFDTRTDTLTDWLLVISHKLIWTSGLKYLTNSIVSDTEAPVGGSTCCGKRVKMLDRIRDLLRPPTLRPLMLLIPFFFFFVNFSGLNSIRPFIVHVFEEYQMPVSGEWAMVITHFLWNLPRHTICMTSLTFMWFIPLCCTQ